MITRGTRSYGIVLPHFGPHASADLLIRSAKRIEELGFDAVWVRDHLVYEPRPYDDPDITHIEPLVVLSALAAVTTKLVLGTATLIPHRHPIYAALLLGSLQHFAGTGRVIAGWGLGGHDIDFESIGMGGLDRRKLMREQIDVSAGYGLAGRLILPVSSIGSVAWQFVLCRKRAAAFRSGMAGPARPLRAGRWNSVTDGSPHGCRVEMCRSG